MIVPIILEARISEYLNLVIHLIIAFGIAFQLPIVIIVLNILKIVKTQTLKKKDALL
ncbi:Sec-independent protein translocase protein TatC [Rickettsia prowazekii str. GvF12]|nr:Sec-independent protein translocase protein TatC [Rickettsia prowazekii str. GvF12]